MFKFIASVLVIAAILAAMFGDPGSTTKPSSKPPASSNKSSPNEVKLTDKEKKDIREFLEASGATCPEIILARSKSPKKDEAFRLKIYCGINGDAYSNAIWVITQKLGSQRLNVERGELMF
jgi:hypothetical protein